MIVVLNSDVGAVCTLPIMGKSALESKKKREIAGLTYIPAKHSPVE